jgi:uncharacterized protein
MIYLPDVNVWMAMAVNVHVHHAVANHWFESVVSERVAFCRITEIGLLRLLTNDQVMAGAALSAAMAWKVLNQLQNDPRTSFFQEPADFIKEWRKTSRAGKIGPNYWTDAYLSSFCAAADCTLITFDRKLAKRKDCTVRLLVGPSQN